MFAYGEKKRLFQTNRIYLIPAFYPSFTPVILHPEYLLPTTCHSIEALVILGDPGADSGDEGKSKRPKRCGTKKRKERREEPLGTMSYQTSSKRSPPFCLASDWCQKTCVFLAPIRSRNGGDRLELVW